MGTLAGPSRRDLVFCAIRETLAVRIESPKNGSADAAWRSRRYQGEEHFETRRLSGGSSTP